MTGGGLNEAVMDSAFMGLCNGVLEPVSPGWLEAHCKIFSNFVSLIISNGEYLFIHRNWQTLQIKALFVVSFLLYCPFYLSGELVVKY